MIRSVLVADAKFILHFQGNTEAAVKSEVLSYLSSQVNGDAAIVDSTEVVGTQLSWGLRDDTALAAIRLGSATGTANPGKNLLKPDERIRTVKLPKLVGLKVLPLKQPTSNTCWATAAAMIVNWRDNNLLTPEMFARSLGEPWHNLFVADSGLLLEAHPDFAADAGFTALAPQSLSIQGYVQLLKDHGPLWIATVGPPSYSAHARVLVAIHGDGKPHSTVMEFIDPRDGSHHREPFMSFIESFEREARVIAGIRDDIDLRWQMLHLQQ